MRNTLESVMLKTLATMLGAAALLWATSPDRGWSQENENAVVPMGALAKAVSALEEQVGGKVLEIRTADRAGEPVFEAAMSRDDELVYMRLETPADDVIALKVAELPEWMANWKLHAYMKSAEKAKVPLTEAIARAEEKARAPAIGAGLAEPLNATNAVLAYYVEVLKGRKPEVLAVEATRGMFIANPQELYVQWTPVKLARRLASL
jgi:hypothetical protein